MKKVSLLTDLSRFPPKIHTLRTLCEQVCHRHPCSQCVTLLVQNSPNNKHRSMRSHSPGIEAALCDETPPFHSSFLLANSTGDQWVLHGA